MDEVQQKLGAIFFSQALVEADELQASSSSLVHYTSAAGAMSILDVEEPGIWFRSTRCMNDWSEVTGTLQRLERASTNEAFVNPGLRDALNGCHAGLSEAVGTHFNQQLAQVTHGTFIACLSEHLAQESDAGRLSMWRGYGGGDTGVALVLNKRALDGRSNATGIFVSKVSYGSDADLLAHLARVVSCIKDNTGFLRTIPFDTLKRAVHLMLVGLIVATKHPGFWEEREWRLFFLPGLFPSPVMKEKLVTFRGVPQALFKLPFEDRPELNISGLAVPFLFERIIIGPSQFGDTIARALATRMKELGVDDPWARIKLSNIPLRV